MPGVAAKHVSMSVPEPKAEDGAHSIAPAGVLRSQPSTLSNTRWEGWRASPDGSRAGQGVGLGEGQHQWVPAHVAHLMEGGSGALRRQPAGREAGRCLQHMRACRCTSRSPRTKTPSARLPALAPPLAQGTEHGGYDHGRQQAEARAEQGKAQPPAPHSGQVDRGHRRRRRMRGWPPPVGPATGVHVCALAVRVGPWLVAPQDDLLKAFAKREKAREATKSQMAEDWTPEYRCDDAESESQGRRAGAVAQLAGFPHISGRRLLTGQRSVWVGPGSAAVADTEWQLARSAGSSVRDLTAPLMPCSAAGRPASCLPHSGKAMPC